MNGCSSRIEQSRHWKSVTWALSFRASSSFSELNSLASMRLPYNTGLLNSMYTSQSSCTKNRCMDETLVAKWFDSMPRLMESTVCAYNTRLHRDSKNSETHGLHEERVLQSYVRGGS